jgi:hypothetical protein
MTPASIITSPILDNDIESNNKKNEYETLPKLKGILVKPPTEDESTRNAERMVALCMYLIIALFCFPLIFCDYYYAINNPECMQQKLHISLTMRDYLIVNAILGTIFMFATFIVFMQVDFKKFDEDSNLIVFFRCIDILASAFSVAWVITGGIMYWGEMDKSLCSTSANDYIMATLIIKIIMTGYTAYNRSSKKTTNTATI